MYCCTIRVLIPVGAVSPNGCIDFQRASNWSEAEIPSRGDEKGQRTAV
jgi:hypothetical protein